MAFSGVLAVSTRAQTRTLKTEVPFEFSVGNERFAAGTYTVSILKDLSGGAVIFLTSENKDVRSILANSTGDISDGKSKLIFGKVGEQRVLEKISTSTGGFLLSNPSPSKKDSQARRLDKNKVEKTN
jgi:hypothetical protein